MREDSRGGRYLLLSAGLGGKFSIGKFQWRCISSSGRGCPLCRSVHIIGDLLERQGSESTIHYIDLLADDAFQSLNDLEITPSVPSSHV